MEIRIGCYLKLLTHESMKLLGNTKINLTKTENIYKLLK